jgi:DNA polymerase II small subunit/DNA polymerase delta subunit B
LEVLLLSDVGTSWNFVDLLLAHEIDLMKRSYDFVLLAGGTGDSINIVGGEVDEKEEKNSLKDHEQTMEKLEKLLKKDDKSKIIFVPGTHDATSLFKD